jgi:hypothetical protein
MLRLDDGVRRLSDQADQLRTLSPVRATDTRGTWIITISLNANSLFPIPASSTREAGFGTEALADSMAACAFDR